MGEVKFKDQNYKEATLIDFSEISRNQSFCTIQIFSETSKITLKVGFSVGFHFFLKYEKTKFFLF